MLVLCVGLIAYRRTREMNCPVPWITERRSSTLVHCSALRPAVVQCPLSSPDVFSPRHGVDNAYKTQGEKRRWRSITYLRTQLLFDLLL